MKTNLSTSRKNNKNKSPKGLLALLLAIAMMATTVLPAFAAPGNIFDTAYSDNTKPATEIEEEEDADDQQSGGSNFNNDSIYDVIDATDDGNEWYDDGIYESEEIYDSQEIYEETEVIESEEEVVETEQEEEAEVVEEDENKPLPQVSLSDKREDRGRNVIGLAAAYIGWGESLRKYQEYSDGTVVGSNIFGANFGADYQPWNVSFVSYILQQAGIEDLPQATTIDALVNELRDEKYAGRIARPADYVPVEGDLVLLGLPGKTLSETNVKKNDLATVDTLAYGFAGAGVAAGLVDAATVASENSNDDRADAIYTRVAIVKGIYEKPVTDAEGNEVKDASGRVVKHNFLTVIEGDVEDPAVAGVVEIDAQYRMTGTVQEVDYDLDEMNLTYDDIRDLNSEELAELAKEQPQVLDYVILTEEEAEEPAPTPEPTPVPEKIEDVSADAIDNNSIGAGAMLGLMVKPKAETVSSDAAREALAAADLSSNRLLIGTEDESIFADDARVVGGFNGIYLLQAENEEETRAAFLAYYDKVDFITPDVAVEIADGETDADPAEDILTTDNVYTEEDNPFAELETALEDTPAAPARNVRRIALIDTGVSVSSYKNNIIEAVSVIGEDASDDNGHGDRMVDFILSQDPEAEIISIKALGADGIGDVSAVIAAINYAIENKASIINLSAAAYATMENAALQDAVKKAVEAGVTFVGAAGNQGFNVKYYIPGNIDEALIVGAADENGEKIAASNFGETVDYNVVAKTTSEAAAKLTGFISANGAEAIEGALGAGLIFATDHVGEDVSGDKYEGVAAQGEHTVGTWSELKALIEGDVAGPMTIKITKNLIAESPITVGKHITLESDNPSQARTIYRKPGAADFSVFTVVKVGNDAKSLTLGKGIVMSGQQAQYGQPEETEISGDVTITLVEGTTTNYLRPNDYTSTNVNFSDSPNGNLSVWTIEKSGTSYKLKNKGTSNSSKYLNAYLRDNGKAILASNGSLFTVDENQHLVYSEGEKNYYLVKTEQAARFVEGDGTNFGATAPFKVITNGPAAPIANQKLYATDKNQGELFSSDQGFFVTVDGGKFYLQENAKLEGFNTVDNSDYAPKNVAPVLILSGAAELTGGSIENNRVSYTADDDKSRDNAQTIKDYLKATSAARTNSAGGMIIKGENSTVTITGNAIIKDNRGDVGGILLTDGATLNLGTQLDDATIPRGGSINDNIGFHHAGAVLVQNDAVLNMEGGEMSNNVTWNRGGAVWATEWGTYAVPQKNMQEGRVTNSTDRVAPGYFNMSGGVLQGNYAFMRGGAINVESNGVNLTGGEITGNRCRVLGGGIYVEGDLPDYTYTLNIKEGYIGENRAITNVKSSDVARTEELDKVLKKNTGKFEKDSSLSNALGDTRDFNGAMGNGGGVWICPFGESVFSFVRGESEVILDANYKGGDSKDGTDFYINRPRGGGAVTVHKIDGVWQTDRGGKALDFSEAVTIVGAFGMKNIATPETTKNSYGGEGVKIYDNLSRDGGGIAADGTLILGEPTSVFRFDGTMEIVKAWPKSVDPDYANFTVEYTTDGTTWKTLQTGTANDQNEDLNFQLDGRPDPVPTDPVDGDYEYHHEISDQSLVWKFGMTLPSSVSVVEGNTVKVYPLYKFSYGGETYDPTKPGDLEALYGVIRNNGDDGANGSKTLTVGLTDWKIRVRETGAGADGGQNNVEYNNGPVPTQATLTANAPIPKTNKDIGGNEFIEYYISFTIAKIEQTFYNDLKPTVEKYINYNVHKEINYDEVFQYDVMAYVPLDATSVEISDQLVELLEFAKDGDEIDGLSLKVLGGEANEPEDGKLVNDHSADGNGTVSKEGLFRREIELNSDRLTVDWDTNMITITLDSINNDADKTELFDGPASGVGTIRGHWLKLTFKAKLKTKYQDPDELADFLRRDGVKNGATGDWETVKDQKSYEGTHRNYKENNTATQNGGVTSATYNSSNPHEGIANNAQYKVNNTAEYNSNTVTVKPAVYDISLRKTDAETGKTMDNVTFTLKGADGTTTKSKPTTNGVATFTGLKPGTYVIEESPVNGYEALNERIVVIVGNDGETTYAGVGSAIGVAADGQLTMNGQRLYVDAAPGQIKEGDEVTTTETSYPLLLRANNGTDEATSLGKGKSYRIQVGNTGSDAYYLIHKPVNGEPTVEKNIRKTDDSNGKLPVEQVRSQWDAKDENNNGYLFLENQKSGDHRYIYMDGTTVKLSNRKQDVIGTSTLVSGAGNNVDINVKNERIKVDIKIHKVDDSTVPQDLPGASFALYTKNESGVYEQKQIKTGAQMTAEQIFEDIPAGDHYIIEAGSPDGYDPYRIPIYFTRNEDGTITYRGTTDVELEAVVSGGQTEYQLVVGGQPLYAVANQNGAKLTTEKTSYPIVLRENGAPASSLQKNHTYCLLALGTSYNVGNTNNEAVLGTKKNTDEFNWIVVDGVLCSKQDNALYLNGDEGRVAYNGDTLELTVTNTKEEVEIRVEKKWIDKDTTTQHTESITARLYSDKEERGQMKVVEIDGVVQEVTLSATNQWKSAFTNLPKYAMNEEGVKREIVYQVVETAVPSGYVDSYTVTVSEAQDGVTTWLIEIKNTEIDDQLTKFTARKVWEGIDEEEYSKLQIKVTLTSNYANKDKFEVVKTTDPGFRDIDPVAYLTNEGTPPWTHKWANLPKYAADGKRLVEYRFVEELPPGFEAEYAEDVEVIAVPSDKILSDRDFYARSTGNGFTNQAIGHSRYYIDHYTKGGYVTRQQWVAGHYEGWGYNRRWVAGHYEPYQEYVKGTFIESEIAYCLQYNRGDPPATANKEFVREKVTPEMLETRFANYGRNGTQPYLGTLSDFTELYNRIRMAAFYGFDNDAMGLQAKHKLTDNEFNYLTQFVIWEYTDFYGGSYTDKINNSYGLNSTTYEGNRPAKIQGKKMQDAYQDLLNLVAATGDDAFKVVEGVDLYIYYAKDNAGSYQCLLGMEFMDVETAYTVKNKRVKYDILVYKYGEEADGEKPALKDVTFDLYEEDNETDASYTFGSTTFKGKKVNGDTPLTTDKDGYVRTGKVLIVGRTYYLVETSTAAGYILLSEPVKFSVSADGTATVANTATTDGTSQIVYNHLALTQAEMGSHSGKYNKDDAVIGVLEVENTPVYELPNSGGIGTYWFTIFGTVFLALAGVFVFNMINGRVRSRRRAR